MTPGPVLNIEDILKFLPHRFPFLLVDRVLALQAGRSIQALKNVTFNEEFFQGHFPLARIMPGVLIVEAVAQAGGILVYHSIPDPQSKFMLLSKIEDTKFRRPVVPGDQLRLEAELHRIKGRFHQLRGRALVDGELAVEGTLWASLIEREEIHGR